MFSGLDDRERAARYSAESDLTLCEARDGANGTIVGKVDVGQIYIPVVLLLTNRNGKHLHHGVVDAFGVIGWGGKSSW